MKKCENCEKEFESLIEVEGDFYCENCIEDMLNSGEIFFCQDCEKYHYSDTMYYIEDREETICDDCYNSHGYFYCEDCNRYFSGDEHNIVEHGSRDVCDRCRDNNYVWVRCCDTYVYCDNAYYNEDEDEYYCESCYHDMNEIVDYHGFSDWRKHTLENENPPFCIGFELEVENTQRNQDNNDLARFVKNTYPVICSRDGSIDYGFEIVSHPLSYNYIVENQDKLKYMLEQLSNKGCESHNPGTCGLHFHVTHPHNDDIIDRIILIMETYKQELITFSRRTSGQIESWCKFLSDVTQDDDCKSLYFIKKNKETSNRYMALNLTNYNTIEFRLFRGTLNFDTFMASVELVNNIVTLCSDLSIPVEEITWDRLTETQYAHTYCNMRNIRSTIIPHSDDEKYIELEKKTQKFKKKALKEFEGVKHLALKHIGILSSGIKIDMNIADEFYRLRGKIKKLEEIMQSLNTLIHMCNQEDTTMDRIKDKIRTTLVYCSYGNYQDIKEKLENLLEESE